MPNSGLDAKSHEMIRNKLYRVYKIRYSNVFFTVVSVYEMLHRSYYCKDQFGND